VAKTQFEKALAIVKRFDGRISSAQIKEKMTQQCQLTKGSASTYFYLCRDEIRNQAAAAAKSNARSAVAKKTARK
jgi:hypothetical protein